MASLIEPLIDQCPVRWQAIHHPQSIALKDENHSLSYGKFDRLLTNLQIQLTPQIKKNEPVRLVCIASNSLELLSLQLLCIRQGWLFCPLNPRFTDIEIQQRLSILSSPYCWVSSDSVHQQVKSLNINFSVALKEEVVVNNTPLQPIMVNSEQPCSIIFTSGSSGFPKAIVHHYKNHFFSALGSQQLIPLIKGDHNLLSLPLFHIGGYATVIRSVIAGACIHLTVAPLNLAVLEKSRITHLSLVSTQLIRLLAEPNFKASETSIKHILLGGSAFPPHLLTELASRNFNYHLSYGCTEMASQVATSQNNTQLKVLPYRQVKIQANNIYLRGETRFLGYFKDLNINYIDPEQWIEIGDMGKITNNTLAVLGRKDRQFISGGENIVPEEIEQICLQQPSVKQAYILPINDAQYGQRIAIFIAFVEKESTNFEQQKRILRQYLNTHLTSFKRPDLYLPWPEINNSNMLKVPKQAFQAILHGKGLI